MKCQILFPVLWKKNNNKKTTKKNNKKTFKIYLLKNLPRVLSTKSDKLLQGYKVEIFY